MIVDDQQTSTVSTTYENGVVIVTDDLSAFNMKGAKAVGNGNTVTLYPDASVGTALTFDVSQLATMRDVLNHALNALSFQGK